LCCAIAATNGNGKTMLKKMRAKYPGICSLSGARINPGDFIIYNTNTKRAELEPDADTIQFTTTSPRVSDVFSFSGREFYRNKKGRCEDAPCCGCCNI
jgi:hypothetical protein